MLKSHDRYAYVPITERPTYEWPNGTRLAVFIALNIEQFPFGEGMGVQLAPAQPEPDVLNFAWRDYGNRVGFWRLLELFDEVEMPVSMMPNSEIFDHCPQIVAAIGERRDEFIAHGRTNAERQGQMSEEEERQLIADATDTIERHTGTRPAGWLGPWVSESAVTPDLLQEAGYRYVMDWGADDQPIWLGTRNGRILSVPYPKPTGDIPMFNGYHFTPAAYGDVLIDQFDEMLRQSQRQPLVCGLSLHTYLVGQPFRIKHLRRALEHIRSHSDSIWLAHAGAIADHVAALPAGTVP
jgi:peptidoglycan/xylan/chitin deacetylase (PgdA/CDA1 family)